MAFEVDSVIPTWRNVGAAGSAEVSEADALRSFDAYFLGEMLKRATPSSSGEGLGLDGGQGGRMYRDFLHEELARIIAENGEFGLAASLEGRIDPKADVRAETGEDT